MMANNLEIDFIREYLIENNKDFTRENIIEWINKYAEDFRNILNSGERDKNNIKKELYGKN